MQRKLLAPVAAAFLMLVMPAQGEKPAAAGELPGVGTKAEGPLAGLPSAPGATVEKIRALGENSWLDLGSPAPDPKWGKARGRAWSAKAPFAPELGGAFVAGQGVHAYVKPDGHYQDDIFFYDVNSHRWICVYPGADVKNISLTVNGDGFEVDGGGQPIPVAWCGHMYQDITYNWDSRKLMFLDNGDPYWQKPLARRSEWLKDKKLAPAATPWYYNTLAGKFERRLCAGPVPNHGYAHVLIYLGEGRSFYWPGAPYNKVVWLHDAAASKWTSVQTTGDAPPFGIDATACYDPKRKRVYLGGGSYPNAAKPEDALFVYDVAAGTWANPRPKGARLISFANNGAGMHYDVANDLVTVFVHTGDANAGVHAYDPATNEWKEPRPLPPGVAKYVRSCWTGFYDPQSNAHFFHAAGDSTDNGTMLVYRYKPAAAKAQSP